jgi:hypothetical protein
MAADCKKRRVIFQLFAVGRSVRPLTPGARVPGFGASSTWKPAFLIDAAENRTLGFTIAKY